MHGGASEHKCKHSENCSTAWCFHSKLKYKNSWQEYCSVQHQMQHVIVGRCLCVHIYIYVYFTINNKTSFLETFWNVVNVSLLESNDIFILWRMLKAGLVNLVCDTGIFGEIQYTKWMCKYVDMDGCTFFLVLHSLLGRELLWCCLSGFSFLSWTTCYLWAIGWLGLA